MDPQALAHELESRGFSAFPGLGPVASHVSAAYVRRSDLVLLIDRTDPEAGPADPAAPHRASRRMGPFAAPLEDVVRLARSLPTSFVAPLARILVIEIADAPPTSEDKERLGTYVTPKRGQVLLGAIHVAPDHKTLHANNGLSPSRTGLPQSDDLLRWAEAFFRGTLEIHQGRSSPDFVALFSSRAVGGASFLFSPIAGAALLGWNLHRTRRTLLGLALVAATTMVLGVVLGVSSAVDNGRLGFVMPAVAIGATISFAKLTKQLFGVPFKKASFGLAVVLSVASVVVLVGVVMVPMVGYEMLNEREVASASGGKVFFDRKTTPESATKVAALLQERGVLAGPESGVMLHMEGREHLIKMQLPDPHAHEPHEVQDFYKSVVSDLSTTVFEGEVVAVVFQTSLGVEVGRVSSR